MVSRIKLDKTKEIPAAYVIVDMKPDPRKPPAPKVHAWAVNLFADLGKGMLDKVIEDLNGR